MMRSIPVGQQRDESPPATSCTFYDPKINSSLSSADNSTLNTSSAQHRKLPRCNKQIRENRLWSKTTGEMNIKITKCRAGRAPRCML